MHHTVKSLIEELQKLPMDKEVVFKVYEECVPDEATWALCSYGVILEDRFFINEERIFDYEEDFIEDFIDRSYDLSEGVAETLAIQEAVKARRDVVSIGVSPWLPPERTS